jgi:GNAT superfamily N-acetyltransferase/ribosomal protein L28
LTATAPATLTPATDLPLSVLAELFNRAYEGYEVPLHVDEGAVEFMIDTFDLWPERSRIAWRDERAIGLAMLAVRGSRAWVGGMGVATEARRAGVGEQLMRALLDSARETGVRRVQLEVLEPNARARLLYEKLGFKSVRRLEVWQWEQPAVPVSAGVVEAVSPREARRRVAAARRAIEPWQREDATIDRLDVSTPALRALHTAGGDAVYRVTEGRAGVLQLAAADERTAGTLLDAIRSRDGVTMLRYLNVPDDDPAAAALRARGATCSAAQFEMALEL